jgi:hypothetical protein
MEDCKGIDKLIVLRDVLTKHRRSHLKTLIFCNTVASCRAVEYAINQDAVIGGSFSSDGDDHGRGGSGGGVDGSIHAISYHGDLNSVEREANLELFRNGMLMMTMIMMMTMMMMMTTTMMMMMMMTTMMMNIMMNMKYDVDDNNFVAVDDYHGRDNIDNDFHHNHFNHHCH